MVCFVGSLCMYRTGNAFGGAIWEVRGGDGDDANALCVTICSCDFVRDLSCLAVFCGAFSFKIAVSVYICLYLVEKTFSNSAT